MAEASEMQISNYRIISKLGEGGMGEVFLAEDTSLGRKLAIKMLTDPCCEDDERLGRFIQEAKTVSALNHPNIITIFEFGKHEENHFIATEFIDGRELREILSEEKIKLEPAIDIAIQIASALASAHEAGVIHRDIKPSNIMVRRDGIVKILDFGLAKLTPEGRGDAEAREIGENDVTLIAKAALPDSSASPRTNPGLVMGTPKYMSPEQARGKDIDHRTDIFSFGTVLYEMIAGSAPFEGETISDLIAAVLTKNPMPLRKQNREIPVELEVIVEKSLKKDKFERYQSAKELLDDLISFKQRLQVQVQLSHMSISGVSPATGMTLSGRAFETSVGYESIAVLPFANMSIEERRDYFSEGLTEEIVVNLSKLKMLRVVPYGSTSHSSYENKSHKEIAGILGVRYLLEGSVRRRDDDLRISAQLVDTTDQAYLWSETYRGTIKDIFEIQEKVATEIVHALEVTLTPGEEAVLRKRSTENTEAYQLYLQGRFFWNKRSIEGINTALRFFERAIETDPQYALAWAGIADSYSLLAEFGRTPHKELYPKTEEAVRNALAIDDGLAEVHTSYASLLLFNNWDWEQSEKEFKRAIELNPGYATAHHWYSFWHVAMGDLEKGIRSISRAAELDPVSTAILKDKGMIFCYARRYEEAIVIAKRALELDPEYPAAHRLMSLCYLGLEKYQMAAEENEKWGNLTGNQPEAEFCLAHIHALSGKEKEARALAAKVEAEHMKTDNVYRGLAIVHSALGDVERGLDMIEKSFEHREIALLSLKVDPKLDPLRSEHRFGLVIEKMGLGK